MSEWEKVTNSGSTNYVLSGDGFYISYNPDTSAGVLASLGPGDEPEETALCRRGRYLVLNGDFRASYEKLVPQGYDACKQFYDRQSAHAQSSLSSDKRR